MGRSRPKNLLAVATLFCSVPWPQTSGDSKFDSGEEKRERGRREKRPRQRDMTAGGKLGL